MSKYRFGLTTIGFYLIIVITALLGEGLNGLASTPNTPFTWTELALLTLAYAITVLVYYVQEKKNNKAKVSWVLLPLLTIFFIIGTIGIWRMGNGDYLMNGVTVHMEIPIQQRVTWMLALLASMITMYLAINIFSRRIVNIKWFRFILYATMLVGLASMIYSFIAEIDKYKIIYDLEHLVSYPSIQSFFLNENSYGQMLFFAILAVIMCNAIKPHWWHFIYIVIFYTGMIFSTSATALIMSLIVICIYYIYKFIVTFKKHWVRNTIWISSVMVLVPSIVGVFVILYYKEVPFFKEFGEFVYEMILNKDWTSATGRTIVWRHALEMFTSPLDYVFGLGYRNFNQMLCQYQSIKYGSENPSADNGYIQLFGQFGILGLVLYCILIGLYGYCCIYAIYKKRYQVAAPSLIVFFTLFLYGGFETCIPGDGNIAGLITFFICCMPGFIEFNSVRKTNDTRQSLLHTMDYTYIEPLKTNNVARLVAGILVAPVLALIVMFIFNQGYLILHIGMLFVSILLFIFMPFMFAMWHKHPSRKHRIARYISLSLLLVVVPFAVGIICYATVTPVIGIVAAITTFLFIFALMFILTFVINSSSSECAHIIIKDTLKPILLPSLLYLVVFIGVGLALEFGVGISLFSAILIAYIVMFSFVVGLPFAPNMAQDKITYKFLVKDLNTKYLNDQRDYLKKEIK